VTRRLRIAAVATALAAAAVAALPDAALAHGLVGRQDLPIPRWLFAWGAAVVLVISFVALAVLWPRPRLEDAGEKRLFGVPAVLEVLCGALGVAAFALIVYAGFAGTQAPTANITPTVIYVLFWVGIPFASAVFGDVFAAFNPWRAIARAVSWGAGRVTGGRLPEPMAYPMWLGRWPAAIGILVFAWVELVYASRDDPSTLAVLALLYAATQLVGMSVYGIDTWTKRADAFAVYFNLFSKLAPLHWHGRAVHSRPPLSGAPHLDTVPGTVALLCVMIGTTSFDGFSQGDLWAGPGSIAPTLQQRFVNLGFAADHALEITGTIGLLLTVGFVGALYRAGIAGMGSIGGRHDQGELARRFAHSLIPIALAYIVAHYFSLLAYQGQAMASLASDPLGDGSDIFGTAASTINYNVISATGIWYVQVAALVLGHAAGLTLAHDRALTVYRRVRDATRSQYWMLAIMVGFTSLGLWLLSASAQS
jgi:hypothetical protein